MNVERLRKKYNSLYDKLSKLLKDKNLCEFDTEGLCKRSRRYITEGSSRKEVRFCCCGSPDKIAAKHGKEFCKYFRQGQGCSVKSIACKLWYCKDIVVPKRLKKQMNRIEKKANKKGFLIFRGNFNNFLDSKGYF